MYVGLYSSTATSSHLYCVCVLLMMMVTEKLIQIARLNGSVFYSTAGESVASEASYSIRRRCLGCTYVRFHRHSRPFGPVWCSKPIYFGARLDGWDFALGSCRWRHPRCRRYYVATETIRTGSRRTPAVGGDVVVGTERKEIGLVSND